MTFTVIGLLINFLIGCSNNLIEGDMTYNDISATDFPFNNYTSFTDHNTTMNFVIGTSADIDLNDN